MSAHDLRYPWYQTVEDDSLQQGDLLPSFEVLVPVSGQPAAALEIDGQHKIVDVVVMTQTCDIEQGKATSLLLCPRWDLWDFVDAAGQKGQNWGSGIREELRKGNLPGYHLLNDAEQDGLSVRLGVVDFHEVYSAPTAVVREFTRRAGKRLRLLPPYREHLAQAFARFFMRVGLPVDIPKDKMKNRPG